MPVTIIHKKGAGIPSADSLEVAEIAVDIVTGVLYTKTQDGEIVEIAGDGGGGAGMVISATEPSDPVDGMQWLESTTAIVWIWDEDKWLEFPASKGGSEGGTTYTLPVALRSGDAELPLNADSTKLEVITRNGPIELPLLAA